MYIHKKKIWEHVLLTFNGTQKNKNYMEANTVVKNNESLLPLKKKLFTHYFMLWLAGY